MSLWRLYTSPPRRPLHLGSKRVQCAKPESSNLLRSHLRLNNPSDPKNPYGRGSTAVIIRISQFALCLDETQKDHSSISTGSTVTPFSDFGICRTRVAQQLLQTSALVRRRRNGTASQCIICRPGESRWYIFDFLHRSLLLTNHTRRSFWPF